MHEIGEAARSIGMKLRQLIESLVEGGSPGARLIGDGEVEVRAVHEDSREILPADRDEADPLRSGPGDVFVAVKGLTSDGHAFIEAAVERGAVAVIVEREVEASTARLKRSADPTAKLPAIVVVPSTAKALGRLVARSFGDPAKGLTLIGVTGTNGKTTTTYLVEAILRAAGKSVGVIGTVEMRFGTTVLPASYTTPTPEILHGALAQMKAAGVTHVVMEVTSSALAMNRIVGLEYAVAAFSNLTQDHLDVHGSMAEYQQAKALLFSEYLATTGTAVVNVDDPVGEDMGAAARGARVIAVATDAGSSANVRVVASSSSVKGIEATFATPRGELQIVSHPLIGAYNVANLALAVGIAEALELPHEAIRAGLVETAPPGRVERVYTSGERPTRSTDVDGAKVDTAEAGAKVDTAAGLDVFVDYAHTPDALRNVLLALRPLTARRLICVFGCGGDRDPTKRPKMGAAVAELADLAIVTSDNPRTEDPRAILDMILPAVPRPFFVDPDRRVAIRAAIAEATPGDVVVIAGKGHEDYQIIGKTKHHFDDREEAAAAIAEREHRLLVGLARDAGGTLAGDGNVTIDRIVIDSRHVAPGALYVAIRGDKLDGHRFTPDAIKAGAAAVMVDHEGRQWAPALAPELAKGQPSMTATPAIEVVDTRIGLGKIAKAHRRAWAKTIIGITGSAGKTTTKELTRSALAMAGTTLAAEASLNNETGVPLTLLALRLFHRFGVIEMGMRGLGQIEYLTKLAEPDVAVVVNAGTAHIELLGTTDNIAKAKAEIWLGLRSGGTVVRPADDARLERWAREYQPHARHVTFGDTDPADIRLVEYTPSDAGGALVLDVFGERRQLVLGLVGKHAALDACAALAAAHAAGASIDQALAGLARARPPAMRGEIVEIGGRKVIVDCYNANPASMAAALHTLAERARGVPAIAVLGDMLELGDHAPAAHDEIGALAKHLGIKVIGLGELATRFGGELAKDPGHAAERALAKTESGGWILLKASRGMRLERVLDAIKEQTL
ncbi:MAG: UDP-N-acetylmuramoyl-L-alanyl-D-glutamate--2,6-diaminopimelate ligase [Kofleriaceae bacterium]